MFAAHRQHSTKLSVPNIHTRVAHMYHSTFAGQSKHFDTFGFRTVVDVLNDKDVGIDLLRRRQFGCKTRQCEIAGGERVETDTQCSEIRKHGGHFTRKEDA
jgi:hypothetical protein